MKLITKVFYKIFPNFRKVEIAINGLPPYKTNSIVPVSVYLDDDPNIMFINNKNAIIDEDGFVRTKISSKYIGKKLRVIYTELGFKFVYSLPKVKDLGAYHTIFLCVDHVFVGKNVYPNVKSLDISKIYDDNQVKMHDEYRSKKYKNLLFKFLYLILFALITFISLSVNNRFAVYYGVMVNLLLFYYSPYYLGSLKFSFLGNRE